MFEAPPAVAACWALTVIDSPVVILPNTALLWVPLPPVITPTISDCNSCGTADKKEQAATLHVNALPPFALRKTLLKWSNIVLTRQHSRTQI